MKQFITVESGGSLHVLNVNHIVSISRNEDMGSTIQLQKGNITTELEVVDSFEDLCEDLKETIYE